MAGFDEGEAEAMASNWVQNLRFRFARMGLNYHIDEVGNDTEVDPDRKSVKHGEGKLLYDRKSSTNIKGEHELTDFSRKKDETNSIKPIRQNPGLFYSQGTLASTKTEKSLVDLENLREKRLNFFQQPKSFHVSASIDGKEILKTSNNLQTPRKSVTTKQPENVLKENSQFENDEHCTEQEKVAKFDSYNKQISSTEPKNKLASDSKTTAWKSSRLNSYDNLAKNEVLPKLNDDSVLFTPNNHSCFSKLAGTGKCQQSQSDNSSKTCKSTRNIARGFDRVNDKEIIGFDESKDAMQVFPIEIDDNDYDMRSGNTQPEISFDFLDDASDSDSDFTLDDPVSRHTSPRADASPRWGRIRHNSGGMSPLALSVSPPTPQITGALYHEFSCSDKDFDYEDSAFVANGNNDVERSEGRQRPRSLSHPSTARDCSELCGSSYLCCCENPDDDGVDVVCDVSLTKQCVDVMVKGGSVDGNIISNGWFDSSKNSLTNSRDYLHLNVLNKQFKSVSLSPDDLAGDSAKDFHSSASKNIDNIDEQFFDACVCPECDEINRASSKWCYECGATLASTKPVSSKSVNLHKETNPNDESAIPRTKIASKPTESSQGNKTRPPLTTKKTAAISKAESDIVNQQSMKNKAKHNGRRWEKSNLAWSTFKESHLSKPPSTNNFKTHPRKSSVVKEAAELSRPRSTSCRNPGKRGKPEAGQHAVPGSLPKSHKFHEFKKKKKGSADYGNGNLTLKGVKAKEVKARYITSKTDSQDFTEPCHEKLQPYLALPDEIILKIFRHLSHADLARCACACRQLQRISQDEILWRTIVLTRHQDINDQFLEKIGAKKPVSLSMIKCHGNLVTSSGLRELFRRCAENLEELNFIGCNGGQLIGESILLHVGLRCNKLRAVDVSWSNVGDNGVEALVQNVERLECLCLNGCQAITDHSLKVVADKHGKSLRTFEIFGCFNVSAAAIKRLGQKCPNLETLNLGQCYKITSSDIGRLVSHLQSIVNLDLRGCKQARDACVKTIVKHCPHLVSLVLANCPLITDVAMSEIATNLSAVRCLDVCGCVKVTDHGVRALARSCNRLNSLDLSSTSITQKSVTLLANYCSQNLQSLKLSFCVDVTDDSVSRLVRHCKRMKTLHLYGCKRLRNVKALQELNQSLKLEF